MKSELGIEQVNCVISKNIITYIQCSIAIRISLNECKNILSPLNFMPRVFSQGYSRVKHLYCGVFNCVRYFTRKLLIFIFFFWRKIKCFIYQTQSTHSQKSDTIGIGNMIVILYDYMNVNKQQLICTGNILIQFFRAKCISSFSLYVCVFSF